ETLADLGYRVLRAKDAQDALAVIDSGVPIDLLFSDVVMPGPIRSSELVGLARARLPGLAVLYTSGYSDEAARRGGRRDGDVDLLSKPYAREALALKLREALERR